MFDLQSKRFDLQCKYFAGRSFSIYQDDRSWKKNIFQRKKKGSRNSELFINYLAWSRGRYLYFFGTVDPEITKIWPLATTKTKMYSLVT